MTPSDLQLSKLLANARPATVEEIKDQGESLARNYKPGPRQAHHHADSQALSPKQLSAESQTALEAGYNHMHKVARLILRDSLTQKYGRNPTEEEMQLWMNIWRDAAGVKEWLWRE